MSVNSTALVKADWVSVGKKWNELPPRVKRLAAAEFAVPAMLFDNLLPRLGASVQCLLDFGLPLQKCNLAVVDHHSFFSRESAAYPLSPTALASLRRLPTPSVAVIARMVAVSNQAWLDGYTSVRFVHLSDAVTTHFPLWVVSFWAKVVELRSLRRSFVTGKEWLAQEITGGHSSELVRLAKDAEEALATLPSDSPTVGSLWRYLGLHWTTGTQQDNLLDALADRIAADPILNEKLSVHGLGLTTKIIQMASQSSHTYRTAKHCQWLRVVAESLLESNKAILTMHNLGDVKQHWVAIVVDPAHRLIRYGDGHGSAMPGELLQAYQWWLSQHTTDIFVEGKLEITIQDDTSSCGLFAQNALDHFAFPLTDSLIPRSKAGVRSARIQTFLFMAQLVLRQINVLTELNSNVSKLSADTASDSDSDNEELMTDYIGVPVSDAPSLLDVDDDDDDIPMLESESRPSSPFSGAWSMVDDDVDAEIMATDIPNSMSSDFGPSLSSMSSSGSSLATNSSSGSSNRVIPNPPSTVKSSDSVRTRTLLSYFAQETIDERAERNARELEDLRNSREQRQLEDSRTIAFREAKRRMHDRARQQVRRDKLRSVKIVNGWLPGQKRKHLVDFDETSLLCAAEHSRPRREFKEDHRLGHERKGHNLVNIKKDAKRVNWQSPFLWSQIIEAAARAGKPWKPRSILREAQRMNRGSFHQLTEQVIGRWINPAAKLRGLSQWTDVVVARAAAGNSPGGQLTRTGILENYPDLRKIINGRLTDLRTSGVPLSILTIRGIMVACIERDAAHLFQHIFRDGSQFRCSENFVRQYLHTLGWSERCATRAAQKLPANYEERLDESFLRQAWIIRDYGIPADLRVNTDQTQTHYQMGGKRTWNKSGEKQVMTMGMDEKRAFTLVPSISASGEVLPMQAIFQGRTDASCPSKKARRYDEATDDNKFIFEPSLSATYWSTQASMRRLVDLIIAPFFEKKKADLGLPPSQCSMWLIDCWSVHKSKEFLRWMRTTHPNIIVAFVPGNCTGVWQPLDVGIQRVLKQSIKRSAHKDIVEETMHHLDAGTPDFKLNTTVGHLRDRCVAWILNAYHDINKPELVKRAFELCRVGDRNLSHSSLTSATTLAALRDLPHTNPSLYQEFSAGRQPLVQSLSDDEPAFLDAGVDDEGSDIPIDIVRSVVMSEGTVAAEGYAIDIQGGIVRDGIAEDAEAAADVGNLVVAVSEDDLGRGRRVRRESKRYGDDWEGY